MVLDPENTEHKQLADLLGTTYDPAKKFARLPLMQGRTAVGAEQAVEKAKWVLGKYDGEELHKLTLQEIPSHDHEWKDPGHSHTVNRNSHGQDDFKGDHIYGGKNQAQAYATSPNPTGITFKSAGADMPHNNMPPFVVVSFIIKYK